MTEYKCGSAKSCKYGDMCKPNFNIGACSHYKAEEPQTNEEWFCILSTQEKAKWLENKMTWAAQEQGTFTAKGWEMWLKQPHTEKE